MYAFIDTHTQRHHHPVSTVMIMVGVFFTLLITSPPPPSCHLQLPLCATHLNLLWVAVKELKLNCHNPETLLFTMYPYYGNLN